MSGPLSVLVTGATRGIGYATAEAFLARGHHVAVLGRDAGRTEAAAARLGRGALPIACDVGLPGDVEAAFARLRAERGRLDVVFNNAGLNHPPKDPGELSYAEWREVVGVNLDGAFLVASAAFRMMKAQEPQGGRIVNNGSISAQTPRWRSVAYTASKHAITGLTKSIALDGRPYRIACGQIDIGNAASEMTARMTAGVPQADGTLRPEPVMDVAHVAEAVVAMAELPLEANVLFQTIMATNMPLVGRG